MYDVQLSLVSFYLSDFVLGCNCYNWIGVFFSFSFLSYSGLRKNCRVPGVCLFCFVQLYVHLVVQWSLFFLRCPFTICIRSPVVKLSLSSIYRFLCLSFPLHLPRYLVSVFLEQQFSFVLCPFFVPGIRILIPLSSQLNVALFFSVFFSLSGLFSCFSKC